MGEITIRQQQARSPLRDLEKCSYHQATIDDASTYFEDAKTSRLHNSFIESSQTIHVVKVSLNVGRNRKMKQSQIIALRREPKESTVMLSSKLEIGLVKSEKIFHKATVLRNNCLRRLNSSR